MIKPGPPGNESQQAAHSSYVFFMRPSLLGCEVALCEKFRNIGRRSDSFPLNKKDSFRWTRWDTDATADTATGINLCDITFTNHNGSHRAPSLTGTASNAAILINT
jgi:hypothetical protein